MKVTKFSILTLLLISVLFPLLCGCGMENGGDPNGENDTPDLLLMTPGTEMGRITDIEVFDHPWIDDPWIVVSSRFEVRICDKEKNLLALLTGHPGIVEAIALSADSENFFLAAGCSNGTLRFWDAQRIKKHIENKKPNEIVRFTDQNENYYKDNLENRTGGIKALAFSPIDSNILASGGEVPDITLWDAKAKDLITGRCHTFNASEAVTTLFFSSDSPFLASGGVNKRVRVWNYADCSPKNIFPDYDSEITGLVFLNRMGGTLLASSGKDGKIRLWDIDRKGDEANKPVNVFTLDQEITALAFLEIESLLVGGTKGGEIYFWNMTAPNPEDSQFGPLNKHNSAITALASSDEGTFFPSGSADGIFHISTEEEISQLLK